jgi:hypothetical protein
VTYYKRGSPFWMFVSGGPFVRVDPDATPALRGGKLGGTGCSPQPPRRALIS